MWGLALGVLATLVLVSAAGGAGHAGSSPAGDKPGCVVTLILLAPGTVTGKALDAASGGQGFSHVVLTACEVDSEGRELVFDCQPGRGVFRGPLSDYAGRGEARAQLHGAGATELLACLRASVGLAYGDRTCAGLVRDCAPGELRGKIEAQGVPVTANSIARALGMTLGGEITVQI